MDKSRKKEKYRFFEALHILHQQDVASGAKTTGNVGQCLQLIDARMHSGGCAVTMGAPAQELAAIHTGDKIPVLVLVDRKAYEELQYPAEEEYVPQVLIDHQAVREDRDGRIRMGVHAEHLRRFLKSSKDQEQKSRLEEALKDADMMGHISQLKVVRTADRELSIYIQRAQGREFDFKIDF